MTDEMLKADFRKACEETLANGLDLEQVYKDQDTQFLIEKGVKRGIARRFVSDISGWAQNVKEMLPIG